MADDLLKNQRFERYRIRDYKENEAIIGAEILPKMQALMIADAIDHENKHSLRLSLEISSTLSHYSALLNQFSILENGFTEELLHDID